MSATTTSQRPRGASLAWFHCFSGVAGDMMLGSLLDAGADLDEVRALCAGLGLTGWSLEAEPVLRGGVAATSARVLVDDDGVARTASNILGLLDAAVLPERVRTRAAATFRALAEVEGRLHRRPPAQVHFHELGGMDAIIDVVGTCAALEVLGVGRILASRVATGTGMVRTAHGLLPNPAPAVVELLASAGAPSVGLDVGVELATPTGVALLVTLAESFGPMPELDVAATGFGAGTRELDDRPNAVQVVLGTAAAASPAGAPRGPGQSVALVEANLDDCTGEVLAHTVATLLDAGAHDAWVVPIVMKKGRPAHTVAALADAALVDQVVATLVAETGTLGVRCSWAQRWTSPRSWRAVELDGYPLRVKVSPGRVKVEYDDAAQAARTSGTPLRDVARRAEGLARPDPGLAEPSRLPDVPAPPPPDGGRGPESTPA